MKRIAAAGVCILGMMLPGSAWACLGFEADRQESYSLYDLSMTNPHGQNSMALPFILEENEDAGFAEIGDSLMAEWNTWLGKAFPFRYLKQLIQETRVPILIEAESLALAGNTDYPAPLCENPILMTLSPARAASLFRYIQELRKTSTLSDRRAQGWDIRASQEAIQRYLPRLDRLIQGCHDPFLRKRYAWLHMRISFANESYADVIRIFRHHFPHPEKTLLYGCARDKYAGALYHTHQRAAALYQYSRVFGTFPLLRNMSLYSMQHFRMAADWQKAGQYCRNTQEKNALYAAQTMASNLPAPMQMDKLCRMPGMQDWLGYAFRHQIRTLESKMLPAYYQYGRYEDQDDLRYPAMFRTAGADLRTDAAHLTRLLDKMLATGKIDSTADFLTASAWLCSLSGRYTLARERLEELERASADTILAARLNLMLLANEICSIPELDDAAERGLYERYLCIGAVHAISTENLLRDGISWHYQRQGDLAKAYLCHSSNFELLTTHNESLLVDMVRFLDKPGKNPLEQYLLRMENMGRDRILEKVGTYYLYIGQPRKAMQYFNRVQDDYCSKTWTLSCNPFESQYAVSYQMMPMEAGATEYTKCNLAQDWMDWEKERPAPGQETARHYLRLGNLYMNTSEYGNASLARDMYVMLEHDLGGHGTQGQSGPDARFFLRFYGPDLEDIRPALHAYTRAAASTRDPELRAEIQYGIVNCLQTYDLKKNSANKRAYLKARAELMQRYTHTKTFLTILMECGTLRKDWMQTHTVLPWPN